MICCIRQQIAELRSAGQARAPVPTWFLHALQFAQRHFVLHVAGIQCGRWLKQHDPGFFVGYRTVLESPRHYDELSFFQPDMPVAKLHSEAALDYQEHLLFVLVMMPDEFTLQLVQLPQMAIELATV